MSYNPAPVTLALHPAHPLVRPHDADITTVIGSEIEEPATAHNAPVVTAAVVAAQVETAMSVPLVTYKRSQRKTDQMAGPKRPPKPLNHAI